MTEQRCRCCVPSEDMAVMHDHSICEHPLCPERDGDARAGLLPAKSEGWAHD